jgi:single-strand DNA-binding protein
MVRLFVKYLVRPLGKGVLMYHKVILTGYLGGDPEMRYTQDGTPVTNFSLATSEKWTGQDGEQKERTIWWRVSAWRRLAETCNQYLSKGRPVLVEGRMRADPDTGGPRVFTRNDGTTGASYEVTAQTVTFLGGGRGDDAGDFGAPRDEDVPPEVEEDAIPF